MTKGYNYKLTRENPLMSTEGHVDEKSEPGTGRCFPTVDVARRGMPSPRTAQRKNSNRLQVAPKVMGEFKLVTLVQIASRAESRVCTPRFPFV